MKKVTKKIALGIFSIVIIGLTSCSEKTPTQYEIVKKNAEDNLKSKMNDPESYEFVKLELKDSVLYNDNIKYRRDGFRKDINYEQNRLERLESYKKEIPSMYDENEVTEIKNKILKYENVLTKIDSLETVLADKKNNVASYTYSYSFRGNNALGAKIINEYVLQTNPSPDFKILNMTDDKDKVYLNPNDFPGYRDMIAKFYE